MPLSCSFNKVNKLNKIISIQRKKEEKKAKCFLLNPSLNKMTLDL